MFPSRRTRELQQITEQRKQKVLTEYNQQKVLAEYKNIATQIDSKCSVAAREGRTNLVVITGKNNKELPFYDPLTTQVTCSYSDNCEWLLRMLRYDHKLNAKFKTIETVSQDYDANEDLLEDFINIKQSIFINWKKFF